MPGKMWPTILQLFKEAQGEVEGQFSIPEIWPL
jgi:hypothetical protein